MKNILKILLYLIVFFISSMLIYNLIELLVPQVMCSCLSTTVQNAEVDCLCVKLFGNFIHNELIKSIAFWAKFVLPLGGAAGITYFSKGIISRIITPK